MAYSKAQKKKEEPLKSVAVWLISKDGESAGKIFLQKRTLTEIENGEKSSQTNPYICQPTWNEKVEKEERLTEAIKRGAQEELGKKFAESFDFSSLVLFCRGSYSFKGKKWTSYNYKGTIPQKLLELVKIHKGASPNFIMVGRQDLPRISVKTKRQNPKKDIILFRDQYKALIKLLLSYRVFFV